MEGFPQVEPSDIGWLTETQMIEVDRVMMEDLRIGLIQMMENAGRNLARLTLDVANPSTVRVFAGTGGNGGGGLVAARHLLNAGVDVRVHVTKPVAEMTEIPGHQLDILTRMGAPITIGPELEAAVDAPDVALDAVIGYSLKGPPRGVPHTLIEHINALGAESSTTVIALDTPSGVDVTTGTTPGAVVQAAATLTLAQPKIGLKDAGQVGDLYVGDISVPPGVISKLGEQPADFSKSAIVQVLRRETSERPAELGR